MYISRFMVKEPLTATSDMTLPEARRLLNENRFRHLPVVDCQGQLLGMITDRDLRSAYPSSMLSESERVAAYERIKETTVADIMSVDCIGLTPQSTLDDALLLLDRMKVGALPVLEEGRVVGIFSSRDLLTAYKELFGVGEKGSVLLGIEDDGEKGLLTRIVNLLEQHDIPFTRLLRFRDVENGDRIYLRLNTYKIASVINLLREAGIRPAL
ncbi:MAG: CBS domain-containing protein [Desulfobulbaceae bacterium]|jgi:acetoin utilization protein AcuB|nr:CBS domain-containing protein [Desulfobulbaceae bacterium]